MCISNDRVSRTCDPEIPLNIHIDVQKAKFHVYQGVLGIVNVYSVDTLIAFEFVKVKF